MKPRSTRALREARPRNSGCCCDTICLGWKSRKLEKNGKLHRVQHVSRSPRLICGVRRIDQELSGRRRHRDRHSRESGWHRDHGDGPRQWFLDKQGLQLGTMLMRQAPLKFVINPRFGVPRPGGDSGGRLIGFHVGNFVNGMRDLKRARIFGTHTAGAALPSFIEKLPNGDGFQCAEANYISKARFWRASASGCGGAPTRATAAGVSGSRVGVKLDT